MLAHITKDDNGNLKNQTLADHSRHSAEYAREALEDTGFQNCAYLAGLLHDMGKAKQEYQDYIQDAVQGKNVIRGLVNHTFAGVIYFLEKYHDYQKLKNGSITQQEYLAAEIISFVIGSHHGMFDACDLEGEDGFRYRLHKDRDEIHYEESKRNFISEVASEDEIEELFLKASHEISLFWEDICGKYSKKEAFFELSMLCRMLLSAVIYGDRKDTIEFTYGISLKETKISWENEIDYFESKIKCFSSDSAINKVRSYISDQCLKAAELKSGIYRLDLPTGAGKTLCSLRYALNHARKYNKSKIIFVIPLLSILDQNSKVIKDYVSDEELVLEHYSNIFSEVRAEEKLDKYELLTTMYNSPIVITTMVQFLNILFTDKTSAIGRMQALNNSIVVIDEIQSLPKKTVLMFNMAMNFLSEYCNADIVLSSATQPCFEKVKWRLRYAPQAELVTLTEEQNVVFKRFKIINKVTPYGMDLDELFKFSYELTKKFSSILIVCNTKKEARSVYRKISKIKDLTAYHLSTSMCKAHRKYVLEELTKKLSEIQRAVQNGERPTPLLCISTQLVEAGVDFSFEAVVRIMAGLDNLAQAAGRCNRSGEYPNGGSVYLINLKNEKLKGLPDIQTAQNCTHSVLADKNISDYLGKTSMERYYEKLFRESEEILPYKAVIDGISEELSDLLANHNSHAKQNDNKNALRQPFKTVGRTFKVFEDDTLDVIVPYKDATEKLNKLEKFIEDNPFDFKTIRLKLRELREYCVGIYDNEVKDLENKGLITSALDNRINILSAKAYKEDVGMEIPEEYSVDTFIL